METKPINVVIIDPCYIITEYRGKQLIPYMVSSIARTGIGDGLYRIKGLQQGVIGEPSKRRAGVDSGALCIVDKDDIKNELNELRKKNKEGAYYQWIEIELPQSSIYYTLQTRADRQGIDVLDVKGTIIYTIT